MAAGSFRHRAQRWLIPGDDASKRERQEEHCLSYGLSWLEHNASEGFRWSRRFFGLYPDVEGAREIQLTFESVTATTLAFFVESHRVESRPIVPGVQSITFSVPKGHHTSGAPHFGFAVGETFQTDDDARIHGIRLVNVRLSTDLETVLYEAQAFSHNGNKADWLRCDDQFRVGGATRWSFRRNWKLNVAERTAELSLLRSTPLKLYVELAWLCNLRCPSCFQAYVPNNLRKEAIHFMSPYIFREIAENLFSGASMVWYMGNGETLLHPNIDTILGTAREFRFIPALLTNGTLFSEHNMKLLVEGGFFLSISVDSPYEKDFERLRARARFSKLVGALEHLQKLQGRIRNQRFNLRIQCVAQRSNLHQLVDLVRWSAKYGALEVQFLALHNYGHHSEYIEQARLIHEAEYANRQLIAAIREGTKLEVRVRPCAPVDPTPSLLHEWQDAIDENLAATGRVDSYYHAAPGLAEHPVNHPERRCYMAWAELFVCADGNVAPCCVNLDETTVGNLYDEDFRTIWNGPRMSEWRRTVNHDPKGICQFGTCIFRNPAADPGLVTG